MRRNMFLTIMALTAITALIIAADKEYKPSIQDVNNEPQPKPIKIKELGLIRRTIHKSKTALNNFWKWLY